MELTPGQEVQRELTGGEDHSYPVTLAAGQFLRAVVAEDGIDVEVRLLDPEGRPAILVDGPSTPHEDEDLAAVAEQPGLYTLEVRSGERGRHGRYRLRLELRPAGEAERRRVEAVRLTQSAVDRMRNPGPESLRQQVEEREHALTLWQELDERGHVASTFYQLGIARYLLGQVVAGAADLHRAADLWRDLGVTTSLVYALYEEGHADEKLGRLEEARQHFEEARRLLDAPDGDRILRIKLLNNLGSLLIDLGQPSAAVDPLQDALTLASQAGDVARQVNALNILGSAYTDLAERQKALRAYQDALALARRLPDHRYEATVLNNLGYLYDLLGDEEKALRRYRQALDLARDPGNRARTLNNIGLAQLRLAKPEEARKSFRQAVDLAEQVGDRRTEAQALDNLGYLELSLHHPAKALEQCRQALTLAAGDPEIEAAVRTAMGAAERELKDLEAAGEDLARALAISRERGDGDREANVLLNLARVARARGDFGGAVDLTAKAIALVESLRTGVASLDLRASFLASVQSYYEFYVDTLMAAGRRAEALDASERARARSLLELLGSAKASLRREVPPELIERERQASDAVSKTERRRARVIADSPSDAKAIAEAVRDRDAAIEAYQQVEGEVRASSPSYASLSQPLTSPEIQKLLDGRTLLLEYSLGSDRSYLWAVTATAIRSYALPPRQAIEKVARRFYEQATTRSRDPQASDAVKNQADAAAAVAAGELSRMVLAPAARLLADRRLLVVSDGALQYVPFEALPDPAAKAASYLVEQHEVVSLPSASVLSVLRRQSALRPPPKRTLAALGDPVFQADDDRVARKKAPAGTAPHPAPRHDLASRDCSSQTFHRLLFSGEEVKEIAKLVSPRQNVLAALGFDASLPLVTSGRLSQYGLLHFATHGCVDNRHPELSGLVFSQVDPQGRPREGILWLKDIYGLNLNADLVVLSACQTALGKEIQGEGLVGLTRGFLYAGSSRVLASLWKVDDRATAQLMKRFYGSLLGREPQRAAAALRQAQLAMMQDPRWRSPYYWAAFSLQGEWR